MTRNWVAVGISHNGLHAVGVGAIGGCVVLGDGQIGRGDLRRAVICDKAGIHLLGGIVRQFSGYLCDTSTGTGEGSTSDTVGFGGAHYGVYRGTVVGGECYRLGCKRIIASICHDDLHRVSVNPIRNGVIFNDGEISGRKRGYTRHYGDPQCCSWRSIALFVIGYRA